MPATVTQIGSNVRVTAVPRGISDVEAINSELIFTYTDGAVDNAGFVGGFEPLPDDVLISPVDAQTLVSAISGDILVSVIDGNLLVSAITGQVLTGVI